MKGQKLIKNIKRMKQITKKRKRKRTLDTGTSLLKLFGQAKFVFGQVIIITWVKKLMLSSESRNILDNGGMQKDLFTKVDSVQYMPTI